MTIALLLLCVSCTRKPLMVHPFLGARPLWSLCLGKEVELGATPHLILCGTMHFLHVSACIDTRVSFPTALVSPVVEC